MITYGGRSAIVKKTDLIIIVFFIILAIFFYLLFLKSENTNSATVYIDGEVYMGISLLENKQYKINLNEYHYVINVKDKKIAVILADCPDKICEKTGYIGTSGAVIVCLPSKMVIEINGNKDLDAITY